MKTSIVLASIVAAMAATGAPSAAFAQAPAAPAASAQAAPTQAPPPTTNTEKKDDGWDVVIYPVLAYIPLAGININLPEAPPCTGCAPGVPTANGDTGLSGAAFADVRIEKGRFALEFNANYAGLKAERSTPLLNLSVKVINAGFTGGFRVAGALYAEGGAKYHELDITATILTFPAASWKPNVWRPVVGTTFRPALTKWLRLYSHLDYTGFGGDALSTVNGQARVEIRPIRHLALTAGYGFSHLVANGDIKNKPVHIDYTMHGPILGFGIPF